MDHGFSTDNALNKGAGIWIPTTRIRILLDVIHWRAEYHAVRKVQRLENLWATNQPIVQKVINQISKFGWKIPNFNLSMKILKGVEHLWNKFMLMLKRHMPKHQQLTLQHEKGKG